MPKNQHIRVARKAGKDLLSRNHKKKQGRKRRRGPNPNTPAVIANSLFALTIAPLSGITVECNKSLIKGAGSIYNDLLSCYEKLLPAEMTRVPDESLPVEQKLDQLVNLIRLALPSAFQFNIENKKGRYCLVIYCECRFVNYLPCIQVGPALLKLKKDYPALHDLFIQFLATFIRITKVDTWYDDVFEYGIEGLKDSLWQIENDDRGESGDADPEWVEEAKKDIELYERGDACIYEHKLIRTKKTMSVEEILSSLKRLKRKHPVTKIINDGCAFLASDLSMFSFMYNPKDEEEYDDSCTLQFGNQAMIQWKYEGPVTDEYDQWIDCQANEGGVESPILSEVIVPNQKTKFDEKAFLKNCAWPADLVFFFRSANDILNKYPKK